LFFFFPEEIELTEEKAEYDQTDLVGWKDDRQPCQKFNPERGGGCNAKQMEERFSYIDNGHTGKRENDHDQDKIPAIPDIPFGLQARNPGRFRHISS